jgi:catechol 2,3-dioxygenase-like lactoylglutathione lyase family enzyme
MAGEARPTGGKLWARHIFRVSDLAKSVAFYCEKLGFTQDWMEGGDDPAVAQVSRLGVTIILDKQAYWPKAGLPSVVSLTLNDVPQRPALDALHRELTAAGVDTSKAPSKVHWDPNVYEMEITDPDGNVLLFWGHVPPSPVR